MLTYAEEMYSWETLPVGTSGSEIREIGNQERDFYLSTYTILHYLIFFFLAASIPHFYYFESQFLKESKPKGSWPGGMNKRGKNPSQSGDFRHDLVNEQEACGPLSMQRIEVHFITLGNQNCTTDMTTYKWNILRKLLCKLWVTITMKG